MLITIEGITKSLAPGLGVLDLACGQAVLSSCVTGRLCYVLFCLGHLVDSVDTFTLSFSFSAVSDAGAVRSPCPARSC